MLFYLCIRAVVVLPFLFLPLAAQVTVSILTFQNSDSAHKDRFLDKSITEMVTVDLVGVQGITVIERSDIERILKEQALALSGALEESSAPQIGKLLGARYLVFGTYKIKRQKIDVYYKIIEVETGVIRHAGASSGRLRRFMELKNNLVGSIYRSLRSVVAGLGPYAFPPGEVQVTVEDVKRYGQALDFADREDYEKAQSILKGFSSEKASFSYAQRSLMQIEKRLRKYDKEHDRHIDRTAGGPVTYSSFLKTATGYFNSARYSKCIEYCHSVRDLLPKTPADSMMSLVELCDYYLISSFKALGNADSTAFYGEKFLKHFTGSMYFASIRQMVLEAISAMEERDNPPRETLQKIETMIKSASFLTGEEAVLEYFNIASEFFSIKQWGRALEWYKRIDISKLPAGVEGDLIAYQIFLCYYNLKDSKEANSVFEFAKTRYPASQFIGVMRQLADMIPE